MRCRIPFGVTSRKARAVSIAAVAAAAGETEPSQSIPASRVDTNRDDRICAVANSRKTDVGPLIRKRQDPATIDDEAKLGRQSPECAFGCKQSRDFQGDPTDIKHLGRVDARERADHEVAYRLPFRSRVEKPEPSDHVVQSRQTFFANAADLQIGAPRQVDMAVAETPSGFGRARPVRPA